MTRNDTEYRAEALSDAMDMAIHFADDMVTMIIENGKVSDDLYNDYPDGDEYHHENHIDRCYDLLDAAQCLDQLDDYEETDEGLWDGCEPRKAIEIQAAYTYGNAVYAMWRDIVEAINEDADIAEAIAQCEALPDDPDGDVPPLDAGKPMDVPLAYMVLECPGAAADYAEDNGSEWASRLRAGFVADASDTALPIVIRDLVGKIIDQA